MCIYIYVCMCIYTHHNKRNLTKIESLGQKAEPYHSMWITGIVNYRPNIRILGNKGSSITGPYRKR